MAFEQELIALGRILFGGYFAISGLNHFMKPEQLSGWVSSKKLPAPELLVYFSGGQLLLGGLGLVTGLMPVLSIGALVSFLLVTTPLFHNFWDMEEEAQDHMINFMKNIALVGALLIVLGASTMVFGSYTLG